MRGAALRSGEGRVGRRAEQTQVERVVALAAYLYKRRGSPLARDDILADVPGFPDPTTEPEETCRKALRRALADLEKHLGIVVDYDSSANTYRLREPYLTPKQRDALVAAAAVANVQGVGEPGPDDIGGGVDDDGHRVFVTVPRRVLALYDAIRSRTPVSFDYHGSRRTFRPYALGVLRAHWYVTGAEQPSGDRRQLRVDRMEGDVEPAGAAGSYELPDDFDAAAAIRGVDPFTWGADPRVVARIIVEPDHESGFLQECGGAVVERSGDGSVIEVEVAHYDAFRWRLLAFGTHARVLAPPELVAHVRSHLAALAARE